MVSETKLAWEDQQDHPHRVPGHIRGKGSYNNYADHLGVEVLLYAVVRYSWNKGQHYVRIIIIKNKAKVKFSITFY